VARGPVQPRPQADRGQGAGGGDLALALDWRRAGAPGIAGPRGTRPLLRCGWGHLGDAGSVASWRERVPSVPGVPSRRQPAQSHITLMASLDLNSPEFWN